VYSGGTDETYRRVRARGFLRHITSPMVAGHLEDEMRYGEPVDPNITPLFVPAAGFAG